jgi:hypothetical protein
MTRLTEAQAIRLLSHIWDVEPDVAGPNMVEGWVGGVTAADAKEDLRAFLDDTEAEDFPVPDDLDDSSIIIADDTDDDMGTAFVRVTILTGAK